MKDRERRVDKRVVMKINADNIWSEKRGRGGFLPSCDIETGERVKKKRGDGLVPSGEERRIGSLRRRLQKDSRERGSGIFIIGIPVTVSKPFTALISVATVKEDTECKKRRGREWRKGWKKKKKKKGSDGWNSSCFSPWLASNEERVIFLIQLCSSFVQRLRLDRFVEEWSKGMVKDRMRNTKDRRKSDCVARKNLILISTNISSGSFLKIILIALKYVC